MRHLMLALMCVFVTLSAVAQTQQGYVKTKGRRTNNKMVAGTPLTGASIQVKGSNTVVSSTGGKFSLRVTGGKYNLQSVKKQGYVLLDPDILLKSYVCSSNPLVIVMETPEQKNDDKLAAERKIRRTLQRQMEAKEDRIEELMEQNQISQQQYREAMQALHDEQQRNGELINEMAEHYAQLDYDQMDEFNQTINDLILEGQLTKADSLLRAKGDVNTRITEVLREEAAQAAEAEELARRQQNLDASRAGTLAKKNDIAQDCYNYYKKFVLEMKPDSALYYIEKRASIDPTNNIWQFDAANYCQKRGLYDKAQDYFQKILLQARQLAGSDPEQYEPLLAQALNMTASMASRQPKDTHSTDYYLEAIGILDRLANDNPQMYQPFLASALNNLAQHLKDDKENFDQSESLFQEALSIYWQMAQEDTRAFIPRVADVLNNMALLYDKKFIKSKETRQDDQEQLFNESEKCYQNALGIYRQLAEKSPKTYNPNVAATLNNLATLSDHSGTSGEEYLTQAMQIYRQLDKEDPQLYAPQLAATLNNLSRQFYLEGRDDEGEKTRNEELAALRRCVQYNAADYKPLLARHLLDHAIRLYKDDRIDQSEPLFKESLAQYRDLAKVYPDTYMPEVAKVLRNLATAYDKMNRPDDGEKMYQEELAINQELARQEPARYKADVARSYGNLSNHALLMKDFSKAIELANQGLAIDDSKLFIHANLAAAYLFMGETERAQEIYSRYKSQLHDVFLDDLQQFSELGIIPKDRLTDVENIRRLLAQ